MTKPCRDGSRPASSDSRLWSHIGPLDRLELGLAADLAPAGFWAWSFVDHLDERLVEGDCFIRDSDPESYEACLESMREHAAECDGGLVMYIRDRDGLVYHLTDGAGVTAPAVAQILKCVGAVILPPHAAPVPRFGTGLTR
jgi:hypothetical protein